MKERKLPKLNGNLFSVSTDEVIVGKWHDGRNIYRKCISVGQLNQASPMRKPHGITGIDRPIHIYGSARDISLDSRYTVPLPFTSLSGDNINVGADDSDVIIYFNGSKNNYSAVVIVEYIKISD